MKFKKIAASLIVGSGIVLGSAFFLSHLISNGIETGFASKISHIKFSFEDTKESLIDWAERVKTKEPERKLSAEYEDASLEFPVVYPELENYKGENPYSSLLSDKDIVKDIRRILTKSEYAELIKSMPDAHTVHYDESKDIYTVVGSYSSLREKLAGIIQVKPTGQIYIAYILNENIAYYTNDLRFKEETVDNSAMKQWIKDRKSDKSDIVYMNR